MKKASTCCSIVDEANRYSFNGGIGAQLGRIGGGVTTFDEPAGTTGFVPRISLGISRLNLFGEAARSACRRAFPPVEQRVLLSYIGAAACSAMKI